MSGRGKAKSPPWERLLRKVSPEPNTGCWLFVGKNDHQGYGWIFNENSKRVSAHRIAWEIARGPIPAGMVIDHKCRVRSCVNPDHLRVCTPIENTTAPGSLAKGRTAKSPTCQRGHSNWARNPNGTRRCVECARIAAQNHRRAA
jgi:hypothetical protein